MLHWPQGFLVAQFHGICNRDIKPQNILCCSIYSNSERDNHCANFENIYLKLGDWGSGLVLNETLRHSRDKFALVGTIDFMAPDY